MSIPINSTGAVCFGVCCAKHAKCSLYAAVDGATPEQPRMDNCGPEFSAFEPLAPTTSRARPRIEGESA